MGSPPGSIRSCPTGLPVSSKLCLDADRRRGTVWLRGSRLNNAAPFPFRVVVYAKRLAFAPEIKGARRWERCRKHVLRVTNYMGGLNNERCSACRRDSPRVTEIEIQELKPQIPEWTLAERDDIQRLERVFRFTNFTEALNFTNRVGAHSVDAQNRGPSRQRLHHSRKARLSLSGWDIEALSRTRACAAIP